MKLTIFIMMLFLLQVSASTKAQITLKENKVSLQKVLESISTQSGYDFVYSNTAFKNLKPVTVNLNDVSIEIALKVCFEGQPLIYEVADKTVMIKRKDSILNKLTNSVKVINVMGRVVDDNGAPLNGATVGVKGVNKSTTTNSNGEFILSGIDENAVLKISFIGYLTREVKAKTDLGNIALELSNSKLDEVQVIAYGTTTQRLSTGNIGSIKGEDIRKQPVNNPLLALQGRVPGLQITQSNGISGGGVTVRIQGSNSLRMGNDPLYVIDGVPYNSQLLPGLSGILGGSGGSNATSPNSAGSMYGNPLAFINPNDIESMEVLKDADATSIYGSRAANGAILITTRKGKEGKTTFDMNLRQGYGQVSNKLDLLNNQQYIQMRLEAKRNENASISTTDYDINGLWDKSRNTDWQKELIGGTAKYTDIKTNITGGTKNTQFLIGGGFHRETTVFPGDFNDTKGSVNVSITHRSENQKLQLTFLANYLNDVNKLPKVDLTSPATSLAPNAPSLYASDGSLNWQSNSSGASSWTNPLSYLFNKYNSKTNNLIASTTISYNLIRGLDIKTSLGYNNLSRDEITTNSILSYRPELRLTSSRYAYYLNSNMNTWVIEPQIDFKRDFLNGKLNILVGSTLQENKDNLQNVVGLGYLSDLVLEDIKSATEIIPNASVDQRYKYNALFARLNYNWNDKYIINLTARRDGSSRFGAKNQLHNFGSFGVAWIFSEEKFIKETLSFLSYGKIKGSYGTTGNDQIGNYQYLSSYTPVSTGTYQGGGTLAPTIIPNPYLQWEETRKLSLGLDLGVFSDRFIFSANFFRNRSSNQLLPYALPIIVGVGSVTTNFPALLENSGWEFSVNSNNIKTSNLSWESSFNITIPSNKLISFPNLESSSISDTYIIGQPYSIGKYYHFLGVNPLTGIYTFADKNGNPTTTPDASSDRTVIMNTTQKLYGGFQNHLRFKGFDLDVLFQFVKQRANSYGYGLIRPGNANFNQPTSVLGRWQGSGDVANIQRFSSNTSLNTQMSSLMGSDAVFVNADYMRLKNLSLSWQFPKSVLNRIHVENVRIFLQGQNLWTITKYDGLDPETLSTSSLPTLKMLTLGTQITF